MYIYDVEVEFIIELTEVSGMAQFEIHLEWWD